MIRRSRRAKPRMYTVAEITSAIQRLLSGEFRDVRVEGEISNCTHARSGHWYFTLKDEKAEISCVCFRQRAMGLTTLPKHGLAVVARGRIGVFERRGAYQLYVDWLEPRGTGALQERFERLKARLEAEGLFDKERKRQLPPFPRRIGIVTSPRGAAIADMLRVLERRHPGLHIRIYPSLVQGEGASVEIAKGIRHFGSGEWAEVVIAGRGGGSLEDLWSFNEEIVARAIAVSAVPVVSAVGHETDFTIADFVADVRAPTPSVAAELVVPEAAALVDGLVESQERLGRAMRTRLVRLRTRVLESSLERVARTVEHRLGAEGQRLDDLGDRLMAAQRDRLGRSRKLLEVAELRLDDLGDRLMAAQRDRLGRSRKLLEVAELRLAGLDVRVRLARDGARLSELLQRMFPAVRSVMERSGHRLEILRSRLDVLSPVAILERGYAIVRTANGVILRRAEEVAPGDPLAVRLHEGELAVRVESTRPAADRP